VIGHAIAIPTAQAQYHANFKYPNSSFAKRFPIKNLKTENATAKYPIARIVIVSYLACGATSPAIRSHRT